ncbi:MAG: tRNA (adenosine(37)-N6)-threonylcarbamoyltransferase complex transferase subunit TsaD [Helicobacteraceae bacterium]|jgi:N6-L-threonylcarbamoyladenine synthase|nr:tRNA (adenosine(37)-N6)-threonylcarbamoyltransferase complex transferase subunit TsaD [Helicobacteraceae bacterium]
MILAIESSCDDSALAITKIADKTIVFEGKISQDSSHTEFGGVVPELAARLHAENLPALLERAKPYLAGVKAIAVTNEPGLTVTLSEGVVMAQALAIALHKPILPIHHIKGHLYSLAIGGDLPMPCAALMASGGHTLILEAADYSAMREVAGTLDDAFGEAFDKTAKMLALGYPGGRAVEELARKGSAARFDLPVPLKGDARLAFSFSGLKNSARLAIAGFGGLAAMSEEDRSDLAASFQSAAIAHILDKTRRYLAAARPKRMGLVGGASANLALRSAFGELCAEFGAEPLFAPLEYCSDNAAMIARAAIEAYRLGDFCDPAEIKIRSRSPLK